MNPKHFHTPVSTRLRCPVCHQPVYSRGGIHPQCAMRQSEPPLPKAELPAIVEDPAVAEVLAVTKAIPTPTVKINPVKMRPAAVVSAGSKHGR